MKPLFSDPAKFAAYFNNKVPGAYRKVTPEDIRLWTECGLIHRYGYYGPTGDVEIVRGILKALEAEELQSKHAVSQDRQEREACDKPPCCRMCGELLPQSNEGKVGRPREYCTGCQPQRTLERNQRWRARTRLQSTAS